MALSRWPPLLRELRMHAGTLGRMNAGTGHRYRMALDAGEDCRGRLAQLLRDDLCRLLVRRQLRKLILVAQVGGEG